MNLSSIDLTMMFSLSLKAWRWVGLWALVFVCALSDPLDANPELAEFIADPGVVVVEPEGNPVKADPVPITEPKTIVPREVGEDYFVPGAGRQMSMTRSIYLILVVIVGMAVFGYLAKRGKLPIKGLSDGGALRIKETRMLGNKQFLVVVEHQDRKMLLGVGPGFISYLCPLSGSDEGNGGMPGFEASLAQHIG
ncbi:MAG: FliO/MopB family protein, partial [Opitutales bacterium]|nr:FliO/MopB family protein [Opitutales bacterium]